MVDPSLLRLAADRGVTICFADLDGADGLWVPEERTVLVNRSLSEREVAAVIEHELGHVAIDDQHAELDAGVGRPPPATRRWAPAALTAAACLAVVGGVTLGLTRDQGGAVRPEPVVAPTAPPLTAAPPSPGQVVTTRVVVGPDGKLEVRTVTLTATSSPTTPAPTSAGPVVPTATPSPTKAAPAVPTPTTPPPSPVETTSTAPTPDPTTPSVDPTTPSPAADPGDAGDEGDELGDELDGSATVAATVAGSGTVDPPVQP